MQEALSLQLIFKTPSVGPARARTLDLPHDSHPTELTRRRSSTRIWVYAINKGKLRTLRRLERVLLLERFTSCAGENIPPSVLSDQSHDFVQLWGHSLPVNYNYAVNSICYSRILQLGRLLTLENTPKLGFVDLSRS